VFAAGFSGGYDGVDDRYRIIRSSSLGLTGTFAMVDIRALEVGSSNDAVMVSQINGGVYCASNGQTVSSIIYSVTGVTGTFNTTINSSVISNYSLAESFGGRVYAAGYNASSAIGISRRSRAGVVHSGTLITLAGANGTELRRDLKDTNNVLLISGIDAASRYNTSAILKFQKGSSHPLLSPYFKVSISGSNQTFNSNNISIKFRDDSSAMSSYTSLIPYGVFFSSSRSGWVDFIANLGTETPLSLSYMSSRLSLVLSASTGATYVFKDPAIYFKEVLSNDGVSYYKKLDNDNNDDIFNYINYGMGKKVD
jgi:hypothetical protein